MNAREFLRILHVAERLKDTPRHCTTSGRKLDRLTIISYNMANVY